MSTTASRLSLLSPLLSSTGLLQAFPQAARPVLSQGTYRLYRRIRLDFAEVVINCIGSQSNTLAGSDLFNRIRYALRWTGEPYSLTTAPYISSGGDLNNPLGDVSQTNRVFVDRIVDLPSTCFDSYNNYNCPNTKTHRYHIPLGIELDCYSSNASGSGASWDTSQFDIYLDFVSDSSVVPHPALNYAMRFYFTDVTK